ncbi:MAG: hypothetical protein L6R39_004112 [Caloplaca ligustica]|nr:MAG: hypothetical protein L6R39_004112 [Caloplaca ligustica]
MSHFFANPLSVLLGEDLSADVFQKELYECIRNLDSFRRLAEEELNSKQVETVKFLLNDDRFLQDIAVKEIRRGTKTLSSLLTAIDLLSSMRSCLSLKASDSWSRIYIKAMAGELRDSAMIKDTLLAIRKLSSDALASLLDRLTDSPLLGISALINDLRRLVSENDSAGPLRSEHYAHRRNIRTTVVAQKVELSKHVSSLSEQDLSYSKLVDRLDRILKDFFQETLIDPSELFLHEVLVYDFKSPHREVFIPNPRCCEGAHHGLSSTHPATSVLYQLYLESGAIINISDLWFAFRTIVGTDDAEDEEVEQERTLALFSRALAEMKYLGIIKNSKRKADHLAKLLWNGL